jgi:hypothetical protein
MNFRREKRVRKMDRRGCRDGAHLEDQAERHCIGIRHVISGALSISEREEALPLSRASDQKSAHASD